MRSPPVTLEVENMIKIADSLKEHVTRDESWDESPFSWLKHLPSRTKGAQFEKLISLYFQSKGFSVTPSGDSSYDRHIVWSQGENKFSLKIEIKGSTLWKSGVYTFQQIRKQSYDLLIFLGLSPFNVHCWIVPKEELIKDDNWSYKERFGGQHGGKNAARDTSWVSFCPSNPPSWLNEYGGDLKKAEVVLRSILTNSK